MASEALGPCPICGGEMRIAEYACTGCGVTIHGDFVQSELSSLPRDLMHFVKIFLDCEGNFREVERALGISYPTVKSRLSKIKAMLRVGGISEKRVALLEEYREGRVSKDELLKNL